LLIFDRSDEALVDNLEKRREVLAGLKIHPRDLAVNAAALARANRCFEGHLGDLRLYICNLISAFESALATQDERTIGPARAELLAQLDAIEGESWL